MERERRMGRTMGHRRKGGNRGSVDRAGPRNERIRRGTKAPPRTTRKGRKSTGGKVIPLSRKRRAGANSDAARVRRASSIDPDGKTTVGHRRLWMVAAVFAVSVLLLGGRGVHISLTEDESYRAFAEEQAGGVNQVAAPTRGSIVSADGREIATSLEVARVIATPYQIQDDEATARRLADVLGEEAGKTEKEIRAALSRRDADGHLTGYSVIATGIK